MALGMIIGFAALLLVMGIVFYFVSIYNGLVRLRNDIKKSWANIDVMLNQRSDELPKLINSVKGYMKHEKGVLETLTKARTSFLGAKSMSEKAKADNIISNALKTIFAVAENYPNLKANETFLGLQDRISSLENQLSDRREFYNDSVNNYNIRIESFPDMVIARQMNCQMEQMFKVDEQKKKDVEVKF